MLKLKRQCWRFGLTEFFIRLRAQWHSKQCRQWVKIWNWRLGPENRRERRAAMLAGSSIIPASACWTNEAPRWRTEVAKRLVRVCQRWLVLQTVTLILC